MAQISAMTTRLCLKRGDNLRCIISINEKTKGDLVIDFRMRDIYRTPGILPDDPSDDPAHGRLVKQFRISVHPSDNSDYVSTIKTTMDIDGVGEITKSVMTTAVKEGVGFFPIMTRRCNDIDEELYDFKRSKSKIDVIGPVEDDFMFCYMVCVSHRNVRFPFDSGRKFNVKQKRFGKFNIVIMYTFLGITMHTTGFSRLHLSKDGDPLRGFNEFECVDFFRKNMTEIRRECIAVMEKDGSAGGYIEMIRSSDFFNFGIYGEDYQSWWNKVGGDEISKREGLRKQKYPFKVTKLK